MKRERRWSPTEGRLIEQCPRKYVALKQVPRLGVGTESLQLVEKRWGMVAGLAFHEAVDFLISQWDSDSRFSLREARGVARDRLEREPVLTDDAMARAQALIARSLRTWTDIVPPYLAMSDYLEHEQAHEFELEGYFVTVRPDLVVRTTKKKTFIFDWKLGKGDAAADRLQMECYLVALSENPSLYPDPIGALVYFPKGRIRPIPRTGEIVERVLRFVEETAPYLTSETPWESVESRPEPRLCSSCAVQTLCPDAMVESVSGLFHVG